MLLSIVINLKRSCVEFSFHHGIGEQIVGALTAGIDINQAVFALPSRDDTI
jgi:hypothetical protein